MLALEHLFAGRELIERSDRFAVDLLVVQHVVPVRERAALHVLPAEPHVHILEQQRAERERLAHRPVGDALLRELSAFGEHTLQTCDSEARIRRCTSISESVLYVKYVHASFVSQLLLII